MTRSNPSNSAKAPSFHQWTATILASLALMVSISSAFFSYQANEFHKPKLVFTVLHDCGEALLEPLKGETYLKTCWKILIANNSESKDVIVQMTLTDTNDKMAMTYLGRDFGGIEPPQALPPGPVNRGTLVYTIRMQGAQEQSGPDDKAFPVRIEPGDAIIAIVSMHYLLSENDAKRLTGAIHAGLDPEGPLCFMLRDVDAGGKCIPHFLLLTTNALGETQPAQLSLPDPIPRKVAEISP
jgi:hypothetical protein